MRAGHERTAAVSAPPEAGAAPENRKAAQTAEKTQMATEKTQITEKTEMLLEELLQTLEEQRRVMRLLLDLEEQKRTALVKTDLKELEKIVISEELLVAETGEIEERRYRISCALAEEMGVEPQKISMSALREFFPGQAEGLEAVQQELQEVLEDLQRINGQNYELIQQSLRYVDFAINLLAQAESSPVYSHPQAKEAAGPKTGFSRLLDRRI